MSIGYTNKEGVCVRSAKNQRCSRLFGIQAPFAALFTVVSSLSPLINTAAAANMQFSAEVTPPNGCTIVVQRDGLLGLSGDKKVLSSKLAGGLSGIADVFSGGNYSLTAESTPGFTTAPSGGNSNTTFSSLFSGIDIFRGRTFSERNGTNPIHLRGGISITRVNVHLVATRTGSDFPGGDYTGSVVVRCE